MISRSKARESVYKLIYEFLFLKKQNKKSLSIFLSADLAEKDRDYISDTYFGVIEKYDSLIEIIASHLKNFTIDRLVKADLAALVLAIYEMLYIPHIPIEVSICEAVELVKTFSTEKSKQFVNGVLASISKIIASGESKTNQPQSDDNADVSLTADLNHDSLPVNPTDDSNCNLN
ncbi:MAG: transcription antitermination factor NusB [Christensenellaceae bacterium]|jgi:N utilization substance protein B|nr:transcription antitermination factor NusB [Christensenellaceae bacterium]